MSQEPLRILVLGAGVIGSVYAARLQTTGSNVTLLARGQHAADLRTSGLVLEDASTGQSTTSHLRIVERLVPEERYDLTLVCVRLDQVDAIDGGVVRGPPRNEEHLTGAASKGRGLGRPGADHFGDTCRRHSAASSHNCRQRDQPSGDDCRG